MRACSFAALFSALTALGVGANAANAADAPDPGTLIEAAKQAMGGAAWDRSRVWHESGELRSGGLSGHYESWESLDSLHNTGHFDLGPVSGSSGWDGTRAWTTDTTGEVRIETSSEAIAQAIQDAYRGAYGFFFPQRFESTREYVGARSVDGASYEVIKVTPKGAEPFEVWFDSTTHLLGREVQLTGPQPHTFIFSDFQRIDGLLLPTKTIDRIGGNPKYDTVSIAGSIRFGDPEQVSRYAPPPPPPNSAQWPAGKDRVSVPFKLLNNHIYVEASINHKPPQEFVFDTGATDVLDVGAAKRFDIPVQGALPGGGFGDKIEDFGFAKVKSVSLGGLTLPDQVFGTMNSSGWIAVEGANSAGLLGYEFVKRAVLSIDYARRTLTFIKQTAFQPPQGATAIPFTFSEHVPMVSGALDGFPGEFEIDTGSRGALTLMAPFASAHGLIDKYHATHSATVGYGVGGPSKALLARGGTLTLGSVTIDAPVAEITTDKGGAAEAARTAGNIGGDLLKRFTLTLDYAHQTLWLQPNALAATPEVFDRSGLWISRAGDGGIAIADVATGSAAADAGLAVGDEIVSINGQPARGIELYALRERFKGPVGTRFELRLHSEHGDRTVVLKLADQV